MTAQRQVTADLAQALYGQVRQAADQSSGVRGADWRLGVVDSVSADGTITTADGIVARRMESYPAPAEGDIVVLSVSGIGSWLAAGRLLSSATTDAWTALTPGSGWSIGGGDPAAAGRRRADGMVELRGKVRMTTASPPGTMITGLPAVLTPSVDRDFIANTSYGIIALRAQPDGTIINGTRLNPPAANAWVALDSLSYSL